MTRLTREARGFVVRGRFEHRHKKTGEMVVHHSYWYGPDRMMNAWGPLDYSVHVFASKPAATKAVRERIGNGRTITVFAVQDAIALEITEAQAKRERAVAEKRTPVAIACTETIAALRRLQR